MAGGILLVACGAGVASSTATAIPSETEAASESAESSLASNATEMHGTASIGKDEITIAVGESVILINAGSAPHTATEGRNGNKVDGARFDLDVPPFETVELPFPDAGDYDVTCRYHASMNMVVHVE